MKPYNPENKDPLLESAVSMLVRIAANHNEQSVESFTEDDRAGIRERLVDLVNDGAATPPDGRT